MRKFFPLYTMLCFLMLSSAVLGQKKYDEIYEALPNLTLDQAFSEFLAFQKSNPYFANTYLQLGIISEHKMYQGDPLRDIVYAQHWAENAALYLGNFKKFYTEGDVRSNDEYYVNFDIPHAEKKITDEELLRYVSKHLKKCKTYKDSTLLIYKAIEESKKSYNHAIAVYTEFCEKYANYNEMLLQYNADVDKKLNDLTASMDKCQAAFRRYKEYTDKFPILNYRQNYEFLDIQTFRLDGLTNSDFYQNRFTVWDYMTWSKDYLAEVNENILPLRKKIEEINAEFVAIEKEYETRRLSKALTSPYGTEFIYQLGKYDNSSIIRELFAYQNMKRRLILMATDSIALPVDFNEKLAGNKMRHIFRAYGALNETKEALVSLKDYVTDDRIARHVDFLTKNYGGKTGLLGMEAKEGAFAERVFDGMLSDFSAWNDTIDARGGEKVFSVKNGKWPALPKWALSDEEAKTVKGNYVTTYVDGDYLLGYRKQQKTFYIAHIGDDGKTDWMADVRKMGSVGGIFASESGCVVVGKENELPKAVAFDEQGKETMRYDIAEGMVRDVLVDDLTQRTYLAVDAASSTAVMAVDSIGGKLFSLEPTQVSSVEGLVKVDGGVLVIGQKDGKLLAVTISDAGSESGLINKEQPKYASILNIYRASASDVCIFYRDIEQKLKFSVINF